MEAADNSRLEGVREVQEVHNDLADPREEEDRTTRALRAEGTMG